MNCWTAEAINQLARESIRGRQLEAAGARPIRPLQTLCRLISRLWAWMADWITGSRHDSK
jgi:hypothetical protein